MQTSPILTPANVTQSPMPSGRQADAAPADAPFSQMLSREIEGRRNESDAPARNDKAAGGDAAKQPAASGTTAAGAKPASGGKPKKDTEPADEELDAAAAASAQMLALVANLGQAAAPPEAATTTTADAADATAALASTGAAVASQAQAAPEIHLMAGSSIAGSATASAMPHATDAALPGAATAAKGGNANPANALAGQTQRAAGMQRQSALPADETQHALPGNPAPGTTPHQSDMQELAAKAAPGAHAAAPDITLAAHDAPPGAVIGAMQPAQHAAALSAAQAAHAQAADKLTPRVGTDAWDQALGQKIIWMVGGEQQSASLTLNPPDLGPLQVVLNVSNSHANATFISAQPEVRQALEAAMPKLRDMLGDAGIQLGQASVNAGTPNQHGQQGERSFQPARAAVEVEGPAQGAVRVSQVRTQVGGVGLVDTFA